MKIWELSSGINIAITEEESKLVDRFIKEITPQLNEREEIVAQTLVQKDILTRNDNSDNEFRINYTIDVWRD